MMIWVKLQNQAASSKMELPKMELPKTSFSEDLGMVEVHKRHAWLTFVQKTNWNTVHGISSSWSVVGLVLACWFFLALLVPCQVCMYHRRLCGGVSSSPMAGLRWLFVCWFVGSVVGWAPSTFVGWLAWCERPCRRALSAWGQPHVQK